MATDKPLLLFPEQRRDERSRGGRPGPPPPAKNEGRRRSTLSDRFSAIEDRLSRDDETPPAVDDISPERLLVFEVSDSQNREDVQNVLSNLAFTWVGEFLTDPFSDDFDYDKPEKSSGAIWATVPTRSALQELLRLWRRYTEGQEMPRGQSAIRTLFSKLRDLRPWGPQDRLPQSTQDYLREMIEELGADSTVPIEVDLWHHPDQNRRNEAAQTVINAIGAAGGTVISGPVDLNGAAYLSLLAELPTSEIERLLAFDEVNLLQLHDIQFFSARAQAITDPHTLPEHEEGSPSYEDELVRGANYSDIPFVAALDGMPLQGHVALEPFLELVESQDDIGSEQRVHGTAMASIILHDDLNVESSSPSRSLVMRPILVPQEVGPGTWVETIPNDKLFPDVLHSAVRDLVAARGELGPAYPALKVINISIGDLRRPFDGRTVSAAGRILDWLAHEFQVLFVVSAGNYTGSISGDVNDHSSIANGLPNTTHRKIFAPADSINALTIGAFHGDETTNAPRGRGVIPWDDENLPAPYSRLGPGLKQSVKPDLALHGGRLVYTEDMMSGGIKPAPSQNPHSIGQVVAKPSIPGILNEVGFSCGTSNAAAKTSHAAGRILDTLQELSATDTDSRIPNTHWDVLTKALLVHGCRWPDEDLMRDVFALTLNGGSESAAAVIQGRTLISSHIGHGIPNFERVISCASQRATLLGVGSLETDEADVYDIPLPTSGWDRSCIRRVIITAAACVPIEPRTSEYRGAQLTLDTKGLEPLGLKRSDTAGGQNHHINSRGTVVHEVFEIDKAYRKAIPQQLPIKVQCRDTTGRLIDHMRYGIAVTFEIAAGTQEVSVEDIDVYEDIRARVSTRVRPRA